MRNDVARKVFKLIENIKDIMALPITIISYCVILPLHKLCAMFTLFTLSKSTETIILLLSYMGVTCIIMWIIGNFHEKLLLRYDKSKSFLASNFKSMSRDEINEYIKDSLNSFDEVDIMNLIRSISKDIDLKGETIVTLKMIKETLYNAFIFGNVKYDALIKLEFVQNWMSIRGIRRIDIKYGREKRQTLRKWKELSMSADIEFFVNNVKYTDVVKLIKILRLPKNVLYPFSNVQDIFRMSVDVLKRNSPTPVQDTVSIVTCNFIILYLTVNKQQLPKVEL